MISPSRLQRKPDVTEIVTREWYSIKEVAHRLGVVPATVERLVAKGEIKANRVGPKLIRIHQSELDRYVESTTINPDG
jgi:excisionase family DNA binding protein